MSSGSPNLRRAGLRDRIVSATAGIGAAVDRQNGGSRLAVQPRRQPASREVDAGARAASNDPRPLQGYAKVLGTYGAISAALVIGLRRRSGMVRPLSLMNLLLYGLATEHLSRVLTKDAVTSVLRAPFTEFKENAGEGEVNEEVVAHGAGHAIGELLTCPFCAAQWVATGLVAGSVAAPALTTAVVSISAAARVSDYLQLLYAYCREKVD